MSEKKAKALRKDAWNRWFKLSKEYREKITVKQIYKQMKKDLKNGIIKNR
jgi:hypothetical protein